MAKAETTGRSPPPPMGASESESGKGVLWLNRREYQVRVSNFPKCGVWLGPGLAFAETLLLRLRRKSEIQTGAAMLMRRYLEAAF